MWAKRRGGANPDRAGLNRKGQRIGTETTIPILQDALPYVEDFFIEHLSQ